MTITYIPSLTVRLSEDLESQLEAASKVRGVSKSDLAREAIEQHLRIEALHRIRNKFAPFLELQGLFTERDIFKRLDKE